MNLIRIIALTLLVTLASGCDLFQKNPDLRGEIRKVRKNLKIIRLDYEPMKNKNGKVVGKPAHRPFGDDEKENQKSRDNRLKLFKETDQLLEDMDKAYLKDDEPKKEEEK